MPKNKPNPTDAVYQLKISLHGSRPPIWRRLLVPGHFTLYQLHAVIQVAMGWTDSHLHQFIIGGESFGVPSAEDDEPVKDERRVRLETIISSVKQKFVYRYDFGDDWTHHVVVEKILSPATGEKYPQCAKGKRACPPEDVGGIWWGYEDFLEAIQNPGHEAHQSYVEWMGEEFDPETLDLNRINEVLSRLKGPSEDLPLNGCCNQKSGGFTPVPGPISIAPGCRTPWKAIENSGRRGRELFSWHWRLGRRCMAVNDTPGEKEQYDEEN